MFDNNGVNYHARDHGGELLPLTADGIIEERPRASRPAIPFVWQTGRRLLLLDEELGQWVFAELEFDPRTCRYVEIRRGAYDMEREAIGVLLSRALASGFSSVEESAASLNDWLMKHYGHSIQESRMRRTSRAH
jgi:hypothetical protein